MVPRSGKDRHSFQFLSAKLTERTLGKTRFRTGWRSGGNRDGLVVAFRRVSLIVRNGMIFRKKPFKMFREFAEHPAAVFICKLQCLFVIGIIENALDGSRETGRNHVSVAVSLTLYAVFCKQSAPIGLAAVGMAEDDVVELLLRIGKVRQTKSLICGAKKQLLLA